MREGYRNLIECAWPAAVPQAGGDAAQPEDLLMLPGGSTRGHIGMRDYVEFQSTKSQHPASYRPMSSLL